MADITVGKGIIRVQKSNFKGKDYIDIRKFYQDENEEWKPTKKGVTFPPDFKDQIVKALQELK